MYRGTKEDDEMYRVFTRQYDQHINQFADNPTKYGGTNPTGNYINGQRVPDIVANEDFQLYDQADYDHSDFNFGAGDRSNQPFFMANQQKNRAR